MRRFAFPLALGAGLLAVLAAAPAAAAPFTGFRAEGLLGYDYNHNARGSDGMLYGGALGYDLRFGRLVAGVDAEATGTTTHVCYVLDLRADGCSHGERDLYAGGRIGALLTPRTLLYAKAGYTNYEKHGTEFVEDLVIRRDRDFNGGRIGAGLEYAIFPHAYVKAEYRYSNYQDGLERHQVVGGAGIRF